MSINLLGLTALGASRFTTIGAERRGGVVGDCKTLAFDWEDTILCPNCRVLGYGDPGFQFINYKFFDWSLHQLYTGGMVIPTLNAPLDQCVYTMNPVNTTMTILYSNNFTSFGPTTPDCSSTPNVVTKTFAVTFTYQRSTGNVLLAQAFMPTLQLGTVHGSSSPSFYFFDWNHLTAPDAPRNISEMVNPGDTMVFQNFLTAPCGNILDTPGFFNFLDNGSYQSQMGRLGKLTVILQ